ncbi:hypothetical protein [Lysobacter sp. A03]|uniref:hypothetical protein n=1 Tax=Lysobacter sp. A03 TaxID=1199154 RepID=UPI000A620A09|nr:hypothetical protein [Lysobacter sp. A03]
MDARKVAASSLVMLLASCASSPSLPSDSYEAARQADGSIALSVTAKSERLASSAGSFSIGLTDMLEKAAAEECGGEFDLKQDATPTTAVENGRLIATLNGVAQCK